MRITNNSLVSNLLRDLNKNLRGMSKLEEQMSSGKRISRPSDDPVGVFNALRLRSGLGEIDQYTKNVADAESWLQATDAALDEMGSILHRSRELAVYGATETLTQASRDALAEEIDQLIDQMGQLGNANLGGKYIFAGTKTNQAPYQVGQTWQGNNKPINFEIGIGQSLTLNIDAQKLFFGINPVAAPVTISTGVNDNIKLAVDGAGPQEITIAQGQYATPAALAAAVNAAITASPLNTLVTAQLTPENKLIFVSTATGTSNSVIVSPGTNNADTALGYVSGLITAAVWETGDVSGGIPIVANTNLKLTIGNRSYDNVDMTGYGLANFTNDAATVTALQAAYDANFGAGAVTVALNGNAIQVTSSLGPARIEAATLSPVGPGAVTAEVTPYIDDSFSNVTGLMATLQTLVQNLRSGDTKKITDYDLKEHDNIMDQVLFNRAQVGAKINRLDFTKSRMKDVELGLQTLLSETEDADMAKVITELQNQENVYRAALAAGAKIIQPSLMDFLR